MFLIAGKYPERSYNATYILTIFDLVSPGSDMGLPKLKNIVLFGFGKVGANPPNS
jgi:hypothetical protein